MILLSFETITLFFFVFQLFFFHLDNNNNNHDDNNQLESKNPFLCITNILKKSKSFKQIIKQNKKKRELKTRFSFC
jgi:hypothetical protein